MESIIFKFKFIIIFKLFWFYMFLSQTYYFILFFNWCECFERGWVFFRRISATLLLFFILNKLKSYTLGWVLSEIWEEFYCDNTSYFLIDLVRNKWICGWWDQIFCNNLILEGCCILREYWLTLYICFVLFISLRRKNVVVTDKAMLELI